MQIASRYLHVVFEVCVCIIYRHIMSVISFFVAIQMILFLDFSLKIFKRFRTQIVKRDPNTKTSLSVCPSATRPYFGNCGSYSIKIFTDNVFQLRL